VAAGATALLPEAATLPTPPLMDTEVAPEILQPREELLPFCMLVGLAVKELITGSTALTKIVTDLETLPAELVAVMV
jgi:hypothetical protein